MQEQQGYLMPKLTKPKKGTTKMENNKQKIDDIVSRTVETIQTGKSFGGWTDSVENNNRPGPDDDTTIDDDEVTELNEYMLSQISRSVPSIGKKIPKGIKKIASIPNPTAPYMTLGDTADWMLTQKMLEKMRQMKQKRAGTFKAKMDDDPENQNINEKNIPVGPVAIQRGKGQLPLVSSPHSQAKKGKYSTKTDQYSQSWLRRVGKGIGQETKAQLYDPLRSGDPWAIAGVAARAVPGLGAGAGTVRGIQGIKRGIQALNRSGGGQTLRGVGRGARQQRRGMTLNPKGLVIKPKQEPHRWRVQTPSEIAQDKMGRRILQSPAGIVGKEVAKFPLRVGKGAGKWAVKHPVKATAIAAVADVAARPWEKTWTKKGLDYVMRKAKDSPTVTAVKDAAKRVAGKFEDPSSTPLNPLGSGPPGGWGPPGGAKGKRTTPPSRQEMQRRGLKEDKPYHKDDSAYTKGEGGYYYRGGSRYKKRMGSYIPSDPVGEQPVQSKAAEVRDRRKEEKRQQTSSPKPSPTLSLSDEQRRKIAKSFQQQQQRANITASSGKTTGGKTTAVTATANAISRSARDGEKYQSSLNIPVTTGTPVVQKPDGSVGPPGEDTLRLTPPARMLKTPSQKALDSASKAGINVGALGRTDSKTPDHSKDRVKEIVRDIASMTPDQVKQELETGVDPRKVDAKMKDREKEYQKELDRRRGNRSTDFTGRDPIRDREENIRGTVPYQQEKGKQIRQSAADERRKQEDEQSKRSQDAYAKKFGKTEKDSDGKDKVVGSRPSNPITGDEYSVDEWEAEKQRRESEKAEIRKIEDEDIRRGRRPQRRSGGGI